MYQKCPVCEGRGIVRGGFYDFGTGGSGTVFSEQCRSCDGRGTLWVGSPPQAPLDPRIVDWSRLYPPQYSSGGTTPGPTCTAWCYGA